MAFVFCKGGERVNNPPTCALSGGKRAAVHRNENIGISLMVCDAVLGVERHTWSQKAGQDSLTSVVLAQHGFLTTHSPSPKSY